MASPLPYFKKLFRSLFVTRKQGTFRHRRRGSILFMEALEDRIVPAGGKAFVALDVGGSGANSLIGSPSQTIKVFIDFNNVGQGLTPGSAGSFAAGTFFVLYDPSVLSINEATVAPGTANSDLKLGSLITGSPAASAYGLTPAAGLTSGVVAINLNHSGTAFVTPAAQTGHLIEMDFHIVQTAAVGNGTLLDLQTSFIDANTNNHISLIQDTGFSQYAFTPQPDSFADLTTLSSLTQTGAAIPSDFGDTDTTDAAIQISAVTPALAPTGAPDRFTMAPNNGIFTSTMTLTGLANGVLGNDTATTNGPMNAILTAATGVNVTSISLAPMNSAISAASEVGNLVTIRTAASNNYLPGEGVTISGVGIAGYNGTFTIATVQSSTQFTYIDSATKLNASGGGAANTVATTVSLRATAHGFVALNALDGSFAYTPNPNFAGTDSFTYQPVDAVSNTPGANTTVTITVGGLLSIPQNLSPNASGTVDVPVNIANPNPANSGGLVGAVIGINYDPTVLSAFVNGDPKQGPNVLEGTVNTQAGWSNFTANVKTDPNTGAELGQIVIATADTGNAAPITSTAGGSLADIFFTIIGTPSGPSVINLAGTNPTTTSLAVQGTGTSGNAFQLPFTIAPVDNTNFNGQPGPTDGQIIFELAHNNVTVGAAVGSAAVSTVTYGTPVTLTATVAPTSGTTAPTGGSVNFGEYTSNDPTSIALGSVATESIAGSNAIFTLITTVNQLQANKGSHFISAIYSPGFADHSKGGFGNLTNGLGVTPAPLTIMATANTKSYDSTTTAAATPTVAGLFGNDQVTGLAEKYMDANAGSSKTLSVSTFAVSDGNGGNDYVVTTVVNSAGVINAASLTVTAKTNTKTYDATTAAGAVPTVAGLVGNDTVTGLAEAYFPDGNAGSSKTLKVSAFTVSDGNSGSNYTVALGNNTTGVITPASLTITAKTNTKTYDATATAVATPTVIGLQGNDTVIGLGEAYNSPSAGASKTLSVNFGYPVNDGKNGGNYTVTTVTNTTGLINKASLTITATTITKTYDWTISATAIPSVAGLKGSDAVAGLSESFDSKNAGAGKTLSVNSGYFVNDGSNGSNYTVSTSANLTGKINTAALTITALPNSKTYDATTSASAPPVVTGLIGNDTATATETYANANAGSSKTLNVKNFTVSDGNGGSNYTVATVNNTAGLINKAALTITVITNTKNYDGTTTAAATPLVSGLVGNDTVAGLAEAYTSAAGGTSKTLSISAYTILDGNNGSNYAVSTVPNSTGVINSPTTLNPLGGGLQIVIAGTDTVTLSTSGTSLVVSGTARGQTIIDNTGKFSLGLAAAGGYQIATENARLSDDFTFLTVTGADGSQTVSFLGGQFIKTTVNDGTIQSVQFAGAASTFAGDLSILTTTSITQNAAITGTSAINITVAGTNAALNANGGIASPKGPVTLQATGAVTVGAGVTVNSGGPLTLGADLTPAGLGDDGVGTFTISQGAAVYGASIILRGAREDINAGATVGNVGGIAGTPVTTAVTIGSTLPLPAEMSLSGIDRIFTGPTGTITFTGGITGAPGTKFDFENHSTFEIDGVLDLPVTIGPAGTLSGTGTITQPVTVNGNISAGNAANPDGRLTVDLDLAPTTTFGATLTAKNLNNQVVVNGNNPVKLNGATLQVNSSYLPAIGDTFDILVNNTGQPANGTFSNPGGVVFDKNGYEYKIIYGTPAQPGPGIVHPAQGGGGYDVYVSALAQPTLTKVTASSPSLIYGQPATFTAEVTTKNNSGPVKKGNVTFFLNDGAFTTQPVDITGHASFTIPTMVPYTDLPADSNPQFIVGDYNGIDEYVSSEGSLSETVTGPVSKLDISNISTSLSVGVTAGGTVSFTVTAEDSGGVAVPGYTGTIQISSTDTVANGNGQQLSIPFTTGDAGSKLISFQLETAGMQTITVSDPSDNSIAPATLNVNVSAGAFSKYVTSFAFGVSMSNTIAAGSPFIFSVQAADSFGNAVSSYAGPGSVTTAVAPPDAMSNFPVTGALNGAGFGFFFATLKTAGTYTLTTTGIQGPNTYTGTTPSLTVNPASAAYFTVSAPPSATTGSPFNVTVTAYDLYNNLTPYTGTVVLSGTDPNLPNSHSFTGQSAQTFSVTLAAAGSQHITASGPNPANLGANITGTSSNITVRGLVVTAFTQTPTGFTASFSKPLNPAVLKLYDANTSTPADVTMIGTNGVNGVHGTLLFDPANQSITFKATSSYLRFENSAGHSADHSYTSVVLPDATYTVTLIKGSGGHGFMDMLGASLDGQNNGGSANYTTTFTTHYQTTATPVLAIPDFARGPDSNTPILVPNNSAAGIPITLYDAANVGGVTFTVTYNASLLGSIGALGAGLSDATNPGTSTLVMVGSPVIAGGMGVATFTYTDSAPSNATPDAPLVLGDITAVVPSTPLAPALSLYQVKEQLQLAITSMTYNATGFNAAGAAINTAAHAGSTVTITTQLPQKLVAGAAVTIAGVTNTNYNGTFVITKVLDALRFQYVDTAPLTASSGGTVTFTQAVTKVVSNGVHVNAYLGDVNGDVVINGLDTLAANNIAVGLAKGFSAYQLLDPVIIGDVADDKSVDANDVSVIDLYTAVLNPLQIPSPPTQLLVSNPNYVNPSNIQSPNAADPALSLVTRGLTAVGAPIISVLLDHPHPEGSTGLTEATLALSYDPAVLSLTPADITLGSIPSAGSGWHLSAVVDQANGQIGIQLYSLTPITKAEAGSLVNIAFHFQTGARDGVSPVTAVRLVGASTPIGQRFYTILADSQGALILSPGLDRLMVTTGVDPVNMADAEMQRWPVLSESPAADTGASEYLGHHLTAPGDGLPFVVLSNGASAAEPSNVVPSEVIVGGVLAFQTTGATQLACQLLQIGSLPLLNSLLYQMSPAQLAADKLLWDFLEAANRQSDFVLVSGAQAANTVAEPTPPAIDQVFADLANEMDESADF